MAINSEGKTPFRFHRRWIPRRNKHKKPDGKTNGKRYAWSLTEDTRTEPTAWDSPNVTEISEIVFI